jgi:hypothetical protein
MNKVTLVGPLVADPIDNGKVVLSRIRCRDEVGNKEVIGFAAYGSQGKNLVKHCHKGKYVAVEGKLCPFVQEGPNGKKHNLSVKALRIEYGPDCNWANNPDYKDVEIDGRTCGECEHKKDNDLDCIDENDKKVVHNTPACEDFKEKTE